MIIYALYFLKLRTGYQDSENVDPLDLKMITGALYQMGPDVKPWTLSFSRGVSAG